MAVMTKTRTERDSLGAIEVPAEAYWGAQTARALANFPISGLRPHPALVQATVLLKKAAALAHAERGDLDRRIADAIVTACDEILGGALRDQFVVDPYQAGAGTSHHMNVNEVVASRANELLGGPRTPGGEVHPNDHVNKAQSTNDVFPSAMRIAALEQAQPLLTAMDGLADSLEEKARAFHDVIKSGRTHLQDATPIRLGQEFSGYASMVDHGLRRLQSVRAHLAELALGGTAVGTGINTHPEFARRTIARIAEATGLPFREAENHFEAQGSRDAVVEASGQLRTVATSLMKIANDIRWLGSGPRCGIGEILIPPTQPGSSIMPGKVNPVMSEMLMMVCAQVIGNDTAIAVSNTHGNFELNVMMPVMAHNLLQSIEILANGVATFTERCVRGIEANRERCEALIEGSLAMVTSLVPRLGYDTAAEIAKEAYATGRTVRQLILERGLLSEEETARLLDPRRMTEPGRAE